jgi:glucokinase
MKHKEKFQPKVALLGDVGGTNIRLELVVIMPPHDKPQRIIK